VGLSPFDAEEVAEWASARHLVSAALLMQTGPVFNAVN
jgi:hypothetical protein